jgi:hypothetical protein
MADRRRRSRTPEYGQAVGEVMIAGRDEGYLSEGVDGGDYEDAAGSDDVVAVGGVDGNMVWILP